MPTVGRPGLPFPPVPSAKPKPAMIADTYLRSPQSAGGAALGCGFGMTNGMAAAALVSARLGLNSPLAWGLGLVSGLAVALLGAVGGAQIGQAFAERGEKGVPKLGGTGIAAGVVGGVLGLAAGAGAALTLMNGPVAVGVAIAAGLASAAFSAVGAANLATRLAR